MFLKKKQSCFAQNNRVNICVCCTYGISIRFLRNRFTAATLRDYNTSSSPSQVVGRRGGPCSTLKTTKPQICRPRRNNHAKSMKVNNNSRNGKSRFFSVGVKRKRPMYKIKFVCVYNSQNETYSSKCDRQL